MPPMKFVEIASIILVGVFWGCTNPLLRKGSVSIDNDNQQKDDDNGSDDGGSSASISSSSSRLWSRSLLVKQFAKFRHVSVWLPYILNQAGSVLFYYTLSQTDLSVAVPSCNALALVFSIWTSWWIGEQIHQPFQTILGAALVMVGVAICVHAAGSNK